MATAMATAGRTTTAARMTAMTATATGDDDVKVKLAKAEKAAADKDKELRKLRREQEERDRKSRESDGKFEELYKDEKARADRLEKELEDFREGVEEEKRTTTAKSQAVAALKAAGVKNPERDVVHIDLSKIDSETAAKRAAKKFADDNPDLLDKAPTRQKRGGGATTMTMAAQRQRRQGPRPRPTPPALRQG
jgi:hypothetical protein